MVIMDRYYLREKLIEIWENIDKLHLSYLEMEESPEKLNHRIKLEDCIKDFLCINSQGPKFYFHETEEVFNRSASNKKDFSAYKAATGWNALQLYAGNLLSQPWRKEYRQVKTYSGFYKHQIEANLVGAELMFELMGYKHIGDGILVLEGPICPDTVTNVSKDCLVAYVECQILKTIWEEVSSVYNLTWLDIVEFRRQHLTSPEHTIKALKYQCQDKQYQEHTRNYSQGSDSFIGRCQNIYSNPTSSILPSNHSFPPLTINHHPTPTPPPPPLQYFYGSNGCCANNYSNYATPQHNCMYSLPLHYPQPMLKPSSQYSNYYPNTNGTNGYITVPQPHPAYGYTVPTGQLIELDPHNNCYDIEDYSSNSRDKNYLRNKTVNNDIYNKNNNENNLKQIINNDEGDTVDTQLNDWDFVYRNLERQGYSKDLGERGDILNNDNNNKRKDKRSNVKTTNLDEAFNNLSVNDRLLKINEALEKYERDKRKTIEHKTDLRRHSQSSSYENLSNNEKKMKNNSSVKMKTLQREKNLTNNDYSLKSGQSKTLDTRKLIKDKDIVVANTSMKLTPSKKELVNLNGDIKIDENKWQCKACTYINENNKDICEMCSKTRNSREQQMEIGGAQCSKCTLVNPKDSKKCQACDADLKNSPTYI